MARSVRSNLVPTWAGALTILLIMGCGGGAKRYAAPPPPPPVVPSGPVPEWVLRMPRMEGQVCATGAVDPTFYRQDGRVNAAEAARGELVKTVQVKITAVMYDEQSTSGGRVDQAIVSEVIGSISEGVLAGSEVLEYWYDGAGQVSRAGMTYAWACMRTNQSVAELAERLEEAFPGEENKDKVAAVRERAKAAFDDLEKMEEKRSGVNAP